MKVSAFVSAQHCRSASLTEGSFIDDGEGAEEEAEVEECRNEEVCCVSLRPFDRFAQKRKWKEKRKRKIKRKNDDKASNTKTMKEPKRIVRMWCLCMAESDLRNCHSGFSKEFTSAKCDTDDAMREFERETAQRRTIANRKRLILAKSGAAERGRSPLRRFCDADGERNTH
jgi:hypothetical protein